ncbi:MAG TPA: hypothetical protein VFX70_05275 [Mycobacteriales bacterium]|nr:hypothetical protein [Mycobacteriales bacterium]
MIPLVGRPTGPDRLAERLARLGRLPADAAHRALVAIAVTHQLDARGRCRACARRGWPARRRPGDCHTRRILRAAIRDATGE